MQPNQYSPPKSDVSEQKQKGSLSVIAIGLLVLVALQVVWFVFWAPILWELVRTGAVSLINFLWSCIGLLALGGGALQFAVKSPKSIYAFVGASVFSMLALIQQQFPISLACAALSVSICASSIYHFKSSRYAPPGV